MFHIFVVMKGPNHELVPLNEDEKNLLLDVYNTRKRFLILVYIGLISMALLASVKGLDYRSRYTGAIHHWEDNDEAKYLPRFWMWMINFCFLETIVVSTGVYFWMKKVKPFKVDAKSGVKENVPYKIIKREYFPLTGQYYLGFDDPNYLHHEIDEDIYNRCTEGDFMYIYRGAASKFVFRKDGRFSLL